jgi:hypothetical protein
VVPTKSLAYNKHISANERFGSNYSIYVGSPIDEIKYSVSKEYIKDI